MEKTDEKLMSESISNGNKKYQWSKFSSDRSEQFVIRVDHWEELTIARDMVLRIIPSEAFPNDIGKNIATPPNKAQKPAPVCPVHKIPMELHMAGISKTTGKHYPAFWACPEKDENGSFCRAKPPEVI